MKDHELTMSFAHPNTEDAASMCKHVLCLHLLRLLFLFNLRARASRLLSTHQEQTKSHGSGTQLLA